VLKYSLILQKQKDFSNTFIEAGKGSTPILSYKVDPDSFIELKNAVFHATEITAI